MVKKMKMLLVLLLMAFSAFLMSDSVKAAGVTAEGTMQYFTYEEGQVTKIMVTLRGGSTRSFDVVKGAFYKVNNIQTSATAIRTGMPVRLTLEGGKAIIISSDATIVNTGIAENTTKLMGMVASIDPNGMYITVQMDNGPISAFYTPATTRYLKSSKVVDRNALYEGDRVQISFQGDNSYAIDELHIVDGASTVKALYKGELKLVNPAFNRITVQNAQAFENWAFGTSYDYTMKTFSFTNETKMYVGNQLVSKFDLKKYAGKEVYYVTTNKNGREEVNKIIVLEANERTYEEQMTEVDTNNNFVSLQYAGRMYYHPGTILIRNGRLVQPTSLANGGTAFVITDGGATTKQAHVIQITGDALTVPNKADESLYFGELSYVDMDRYQLQLSDTEKMTNNVWKKQALPNISYSNSTNAVVNFNEATLKLQPNMDLISYETYYGYFFVKNGHVQAVHLLDPSQPKSSRVVTGTIQTIRKVAPYTIGIKNASTWSSNQWVGTGAMENLNIDQALIIKNGKVLSPSQLKVADQVSLYVSTGLGVHILIVN